MFLRLIIHNLAVTDHRLTKEFFSGRHIKAAAAQGAIVADGGMGQGNGAGITKIGKRAARGGFIIFQRAVDQGQATTAIAIVAKQLDAAATVVAGVVQGQAAPA